MKALALALCSMIAAAGRIVAQENAPDNPGTVVRRVYDALNRHNIEGALANYADTLTVMPEGDTSARRFSKPQIHEVLQNMVRDNPQLRIDTRMTVLGEFVIVRERLFGMGGAGPAGKAVNGLDIYDVQHGKVVALWEVREVPSASK